MWDNPGGEFDPADDVSRRCKYSPSILSCIGRRQKEGCDRGNEVGTVHGEQDRERPVALRKTKESGKKKI